MELTASRSLLVAFPVLVVFFLCGLSLTDAQRIDTFLPEAGYETRKNQERGEFPRREELLQALSFLEEYERGKENEWDKNIDEEENLLGDGVNDMDLDLEEIYPLGFDLDNEEPLDDIGPEYYDEENNQVDIPPWLAETLLQETQEIPDEYLEEGSDALLDDGELLEIALEEEHALKEVEEAAYLDEVEKEEDEIIADIVEEEMENEAVDDILDDLWAEDVLQKDAEKHLKWLLIEEEEKMRREDAEEEMEDEEEEEEEGEEDPFALGYMYSDEDIPLGNEYDYEDYSSFLQGLLEDYPQNGLDEDYPQDGLDEDYEEETLDKDELMKEAEEILNYQEPEEEDNEEAGIQATGALQRLIGSLTREAIQEEMEAENYPDELEDEDEDEDEEDMLSSFLDAGMGVDEEMQVDEDDEDVEKEVYSELVELLGEEIDQAIDEVAEEILEELEKEEEEQEEEVLEEGDYNDMEAVDLPMGDSQDMMMDGALHTDVGDVCPSLQYFLDDCNIVNNYGDLGGNGYKELFTGACNRHQLCYACGEYFELGAKLCDELFKAELLAHCDADDDDCKQRAKYFWVVARSNRVPERESSPICGDTCILSYLVEV